MGKFTLKNGSKLQFRGQTLQVVAQPDFDVVFLKSKDGDVTKIRVDDLVKEAEGKSADKVSIDVRREVKAKAYLDVLQPLLMKSNRTKAEVQGAAEKLGISVSAAYKAIARFDLSGDTLDLPPTSRPGGRGKSRINANAEAIIQEEIEKCLLTREQRTPEYFYERVKPRLKKAGFVVSQGTLRARVAAVPPFKWKHRREGYDEAKRQKPQRGEAPTGSRPLETIQIDHWKTDIEILDDDRVTPIGRAWLTLAIDLFTRVIWGWHLTLESPGTASLGQCMVHGMTRKEGYLEALGVKAEMPIWGDPEGLHLDNAGEFRGNSIQNSCDRFNIKLKWRPILSPEYGCHIERLNGTLAKKFRNLPGATGSKPGDGTKLRSAATAAFTFDDLEKQVAMIINEYHNTAHLGIGGSTPLEKWSTYFFGPNGAKRPVPDVRVNDLALRVAWYPMVTRTLQAYGVEIDYLPYYGETIELLVRDHKKERVEICRDPLDVTHVYVRHPITGDLLNVPCRYRSFPLATIREVQTAAKEALRLKRKPIPETLATFIEDRHRAQDEAVAKTRTAAREAARRKRNEVARSRPLVTAHEPILPDNSEITLTQPPSHAIPPRKHERVTGPSGSADPASIREAMAAAADMSDADIDALIHHHIPKR